jgi:hypothetical protein
MNDVSVREPKIFPAVIAVIGALLIIVALVWTMQRYSRPAPLGEDRALARAKALKEMRAAEAEALSTPAILDPVKGIVRLPITNAMELALQLYQNPAAGRSNLMERVAKANVAPPKAPEKPSEFE